MSSGSELPVEISVDETSKLLKDDSSVVLLDCREPSEYETAKIEGSTLIPMREIKQRIDEIRELAKQRLIVHCHHGGRSLRVTEWLREQGLVDVQNMTDGIDAWSQQIDESVPRY